MLSVQLLQQLRWHLCGGADAYDATTVEAAYIRASALYQAVYE
jgi:hypothetical protein